MAIDFLFRMRTPHRRGSLQRVTGAIAEAGGLIGDIETQNVNREFSTRNITIQVDDEEHAQRVVEELEALDGVDVLHRHDRAVDGHRGGKLRMVGRRELRTWQETRDLYTPGVARICRAIEDDPTKASEFTTIPRTVAICTNGTAVLGLGDTGVVASMPVMEGKALFYAQLVGLSAIPVLVDTHDTDEFVETVTRIAPTFGAIHIEDVASPQCFDVEARLIDALDQPVMHDDVHGTAVVALAAATAAARRADLDLSDCVIGQIGLGAAGIGIAGLMAQTGARVIGTDPREASHGRARDWGIEIADGLETVMQEAQIVVASTGKADLIQPGMVQRGQVILAMSNPDPEIDPATAREAGAAVAVDGSLVNNVLGYPGLFLGALLAGADRVNVEMKLAGARALADLAESSDELMPDPLDRAVHRAVADAVRDAAHESGAARPEHALPENET